MTMADDKGINVILTDVRLEKERKRKGLSLRLCNGVHTDVTHKDAKLYVWAVCGVYLTKVVFNHLSCSGLKT